MRPKCPPRTGAGGRKLWAAIVDTYELSEHELQVLREAVRTVDQIDRLQAIVQEDGDMQQSPQGRRVHPAVVELRQQRVVLARLLAALKIPDTEATAPAAPVRGVYQIRGA
ncbi:hypothetical protein [Rhodococcus sp. LW-XY12]|uniref:hypothetical protein n=1 Tax=Rhodococcus TaxID=1827 RepID=UPI001C567814|nr:hypothetical protein [Rhodococcus sp. LW-XY12]QXU53968.1 hypothetical protein KXC42_01170 [Rhodococcus sp. LW-XY12]